MISISEDYNKEEQINNYLNKRKNERKKKNQAISNKSL